MWGCGWGYMGWWGPFFGLLWFVLLGLFLYWLVRAIAPESIKALLRRAGPRKSSPLAPFAYCPGNGRPTWTGHPCPFSGWSVTFSSPWPSTQAWCSAGKGF
jgi:hypothetical protein